MTQKILKFPLEVTDRQTIEMPRGAKLLSAQVQKSTLKLCVWALCSDYLNRPLVKRTIAVYGTGNPLPDHVGEYVDTVQDDRFLGRSFVWHVFDLGEEE